MTRNILKNCLVSLAALALLPAAATAQTAPALDDPLGIPADISLLGEANPNVRTATAIVNGHVITGTDIDQRVALVISASNNQLSEEDLSRLRMQVLRNLIDETLQIQAARSQEIEVSQGEVTDRYNTLAAQNFGQEAGAMDEYLISIGSSPASLKRQIEGELAWSNLLRRNIAPFVNVSEEEVNELLKRMEDSRGTEEFRLAEIFLAATPENRNTVLENGQQIMEQLRQGGSFQGYARQFSQASTAATGGDLGWLRLAQLRSTQLEAVVNDMQPGQLVGPVEIPGGFWIVYLVDKRQVLMADPRDAVLSLKQISINFEPGITEELAAQQVQAFSTGVQNMRGCGDADAVAGSLGATVVTNDQIRARSLPEQLQNIVLSLQVGQPTPPFGSIEEGVRVLMLCGRDDPEVVGGPSFDDMMNQLEDERVNKRAQRYLRDLRNDAYIDYN
ncbi:MAG: peptidylprolyl isomerase [Altererythrobacter sp.]|uniref:peptidylprolyl isomerase n=1 Tax=uncultured Altererythrobacter sp. TaxID=500840 RepID=UPI001849B1F4|nr:peptidylprolyl isomerase [uncultured Altererythrobacter sp.]MBT8390013.1 peptidylprolyl isomerase [Altererythrobacter sp.]MBT8430923.1 peptidylprolyl isomerase [Altererythrobacter sp.]NNE49223.1 peptidylprolyl isomerase [Altererythrobacter sp.]NNF93361.1 peptidylprolyl isomerase [Altererythrobacter sp.]NNK46240.1 peptidylprolyl isomerase [Altererythrobacter sp.]